MNEQALAELTELLANGPISAAQLAAINAQMTGMEHTLGIRYTALSLTGVSAELAIGPHVLQPFGLVNGGTLCTLAECVASFAGCLAAGGPVVGLVNTTHFVRPASQGVIHAAAQPVYLGKRTQLWEVSCTVDGKLLATSSVRTMVMV